MTSFVKKLSDSVLDAITKDLKPDIPIHNRLKRSWEEHEKRKFCRTRKLKNKVKQLQLKTKQSLQAVTAVDSRLSDPTWSGHITTIPGFRYKANGKARHKEADPMKTPLVKSLTGLSKHIVRRQLPQKRNTNPAFCKSLAESLSGLEITDKVEVEQMEIGNNKRLSATSMPSLSLYRRHGPAGLLDEDGAQRLRKIQEQLGLSGRHAPSNKDSFKDLDRLTQALKMLQMALSSADCECQPSVKQHKTRRTFSGEERATSTTAVTIEKITHSNTNTYSSTTTSITNSSKPHLPRLPRDRCRACRHMQHSDVRELVESANPYSYIKPRWKVPPSGHYVAPPFKCLPLNYPTVFSPSKPGSDNSLICKNKCQNSQDNERNICLPPVNVDLKRSVSHPHSPSLAISTQHNPNTSPSPTTASCVNHKAVNGQCQGRLSSQDGRGELFQTMVSMMEATDSLRDGGGITGADKDGLEIAGTKAPLCVLKRKNSEEMEALEKKMQTFLGSLKSWSV